MRSSNNLRCARIASTESATRTFVWPNQRTARHRRGAAAVFGLMLMIGLVTLMAVTIDFGYIHVAQTQLRRSADAAAMAACWEMFDQQSINNDPNVNKLATISAANESANLNMVGEAAALVSTNDLELGTYGVDQSWSTSDASNFNAVRVTLRREASSNGELSLFFGSLTGRQTQQLHTTATAAMFNAISGFYEPGDSDETLEILPLTLDLESWNAAVAKATVDDYTLDNGASLSGGDGIWETNLYPKGNGAPGNRGTVDIGDDSNSTTDLERQILYGLSKQDLVALGKPLMFDANGELKLNGDTGISAGVKDELATLIGKKRIIPIFASVGGTGNTAIYTIVRWEGVSILDVKLVGNMNSKRVVIQPAKVIARHARIDYTGQYTSTHMVTPVMLVE
jgi:Flp pilus assembly protein TadG